MLRAIVDACLHIMNSYRLIFPSKGIVDTMIVAVAATHLEMGMLPAKGFLRRGVEIWNYSIYQFFN